MFPPSGGSARKIIPRSDILAKPVWTPKAPRRGAERNEADEVGRQAELRSSDEAAKLPSNRGINRRQTHAVRAEGPSGEAASPSSHPDQLHKSVTEFTAIRRYDSCGMLGGGIS